MRFHKTTDDSCTKPPKSLALNLDGRHITTQSWVLCFVCSSSAYILWNNRIREECKLTHAALWEKLRSWCYAPAHGGLWGCRPIAPSHPVDPPSAPWDWRRLQTPLSESPHELESKSRRKRWKVKARKREECSALKRNAMYDFLLNHFWPVFGENKPLFPSMFHLYNQTISSPMWWILNILWELFSATLQKGFAYE